MLILYSKFAHALIKNNLYLSIFCLVNIWKYMNDVTSYVTTYAKTIKIAKMDRFASFLPVPSRFC